MNAIGTSNLLPRRTLWAWGVATFLGSGFLRPGAGSWASALTVVIWYLLVRHSSPSHAHIASGAAAMVITLIGIPAATIVAQESQNKDPDFVVIDEVAGQLLPLMLAPVGWKYLFASFILFRCFDIFKPPPVRQLELLPGGTGIVLDDIGAGLYAVLMLFLLLHFKLL
jgi:phosphatidylglycerophosphatase A